jgi:hypothetical protein
MTTLSGPTTTSERAQTASHKRTIFLSLLAGAILTSLWSYRLVDSVIGDSIANTLLGYDAKATPIANAVAGAVFAFVSGLAGTFTACNICAFSAIAPLAAEKRSLGQVLRPLGHLTLGAVAVAALYGAIGALVGSGLPQLSSAKLEASGYPLRLLQSTVIFVGIGVIFIVWGLMTLGVMSNPWARLAARYPWAQTVFMGGLIGAFLIGRPFPLFKKMFEYAAATHDPAYGALAFVLQSLGNMLLVALLFVALAYGTGGRFERWLYARPGRSQALTAAALLVGGAFFVTYWGFRVPAIFGIGWWPSVTW